MLRSLSRIKLTVLTIIMPECTRSRSVIRSMRDGAMTEERGRAFKADGGFADACIWDFVRPYAGNCCRISETRSSSSWSVIVDIGAVARRRTVREQQPSCFPRRAGPLNCRAYSRIFLSISIRGRPTWPV
ncbi:hypothetical protein SISNIDRAFT_233953 [Sistotremastrum niveocremeum HHB9708]|uniref:Uncharacterized protein n=1 Tax=Sistotremastrum niveocremeum HHB9708 TaxID=1314777 RepID=A0A164PUN8_9AGAM|nr:hypothetical protein SISNIDRAFT_233953 [Sistotremastrum niveocremeum HHB9708]